LSAAKKHLQVIEDNQTSVFAQVIEDLSNFGFDVLGNFGWLGKDLQQVGEGCIEGWGKAEAAINYIIELSFDFVYEAEGKGCFANAADSEECDEACAIVCYPVQGVTTRLK
jgi:hypothetical protein